MPEILHKKLFWFSVFLLVSTTALCQPKINSPFSRFGFGDLLEQEMIGVSGMGKLSAAYHDGYHTNFVNPASFSWLQSTAFDVGLSAKYSSLQGTVSSANSWSGNLSYMSISFPMKNPINRAFERKKTDWSWGMGIGLLPYSIVGYDVEATTIDPEAGLVVQSYQGNGGTYKIMLGNGVRWKNIAAGINIGYLFGKLSNERRVGFPNLTVPYINVFEDDLSVGAVVWNVGFQYDYYLNTTETKSEEIRGDKLSIGVYGNPTISMRTRGATTYLRARDFNSFIGEYNEIDTISALPELDVKGKLPAEFGIGIIYEKINKVRLGLNYTYAGWSAYENNARPEQLEDSWRFSLGGEYIPDYISYNNYLNRVNYRLGAFYGKDPRMIEGEQITTYGITLGFGFPILLPQQQKSFLNVTAEFGQQGIETFEETYVKLSIGFTLNNNRWFFKRKFN